MFALLALAFPGVLLLVMLAMDRVEAPLRVESVGERLIEFFDGARPDELERVVRQDLGEVLDRYWRRRNLRARLMSRRP
jgi:hypothetical protein